MKKLFQKPIFNYLFQALILYVLVFAYYWAVSNGLGNKPFYLQMRRFLPCALFTLLPMYLVGSSLFSKYFLSHILVGLSWIITYPLFYWLTNHVVEAFFSNHFDIVFGLYGAIACMVSLHLFLLYNFSKKKIINIIISLLQLILMILPVFQWLYFAIYGTSVSEAGLMAFYQTNINETLEYFKTIGYHYTLAPIIIFTILFYVLYKLNTITSTYEFKPWSKKLNCFFVFMFSILFYYSTFTVFEATRLVEHYSEVKEYFQSAQLYKTNRNARLDQLTVTPANPPFSKPGTIILIVGESASRNYMSAFFKVERDTTPWLKKQKLNQDFTLFKNTYCVIPNTVTAIEHALTEKSQYNKMDFNKSISILDVAQKAGYYTSWFSNQGTVGSADTQITILANTADNAKWTKEEINVVQYDIALLDYIKTLDPTKNNFVVVHLSGSHDSFQNRYPPEFTKWGEPGVYDFPDNYDNSLLYSDYVMSEIFDYAKNNLNLEALVYFSDHGQNPKSLRHPDKFGFAWYRVPLFVYLSDEYQTVHPDVTATLKAHQDTYVTNDLIYDLMCGILNVQSNHYDETQSLTSPKYKYTRDTLLYSKGTKHITDDKTDD